MRVGRPVKLLPQPVCDYCGMKAVLVHPGEDTYPYREDHGRLWLCAPCGAWIGIFARSRRHVPLGRLANAELRECKAKLHAALEPLAEAKARRDRCSLFEARARGMKWLASVMMMNDRQGGIHQFDTSQCRAAIDIIAQFMRERAACASLNTAAVGGTSEKER